MDKYEYKVRSDEIKSLIGQGNYAQAAEIADTIDWRRVKSVMMLCTVSDVYKINRRYEDAKNMLLLAYERRPGGRTICYSLCELCIKTEDFVQALNYYKEFVQVAPRDTGRYILQYKLYEAQEVSLEERIGVLEELKKRDYREKWAYELAYLYHRVGLGTRCVEECDELILWFGEGKYVVKAMELKMLHQPLTPAQQEAYDRRFEENMADRQEPEDQEYYEEPDYGQEAVQEGDYGWPAEEQGQQEGQQPTYAQEGGSAQEQPEELDIQVKTMDVGKYNTINLQAELAAGLQEVLGADRAARGDAAAGEPGQGGDIRAAGQPEDAGYQNYAEEEIEDSEVFFGATGELEDASLELEAVNGGEPGYGAAGQQGYVAEEMATEGQGHGAEQSGSKQRTLEAVPAGHREAQAERNVAAEDMGALPEAGTDALRDGADGTPGQETAQPQDGQRPTSGIQPPRELAEVLSQEANGQISIVLPESIAVEKQITGQMKIEDILVEWERIKKENEAKCQEEVRQHVLSQTGPMFTEFEANVRDGLLEQLEKGEAQQPGEGSPAEPEAVAVEAEATAAELEQAGAEIIEDAFESGSEYMPGEEEPGYTEEAVYEDEMPVIEGQEQAYETGYEDEASAVEEELEYTEEAVYEAEASGMEEEPGYTEEAVYEDEAAYEEEGQEYTDETGYEDEASAVEEELEYTEEAVYEDEAAYEEEGQEYTDETGYEDEASAVEEELEYMEEAVYEDEASAMEEESEYTDEPTYEGEAADIEDGTEYPEETVYGDEPEYIEQAGTEDAPETWEGEYSESGYDRTADLEADDVIDEIEEIQEQIEKAQERENPALTGKPKAERGEEKTEKADMTGEAMIERDQAKVRSLTREEKELFAPFIQNRRSREQLVKALDSISMAAYTGNLIITGEEGMDTLTLAKNIMRELRMMDSNFSGEVAKVSGQGLNEKDVGQTLERLGNGALIVQKASGMTTRTAAMLHRQLQHERFGIIVVLEDTGKAMKKLFLGTPDLYGDFTARIDLEALSNDSLVAFGRQYAREKEFSIDNLGVLALHTRIEELQTIDHVVTVMEVKQIVDEAIRHASRKTLAHFFDVLLAKRYDDEDMIILTEKDFAA